MPHNSSQRAKHSDLQIDPDHVQIILSILNDIVPDMSVWAFGSRALGTAKPHSDLDIAIAHSQPLDDRTAANLRAAFEESNLPFKVDIIEYVKISPSFRSIVDSTKTEIVDAKQE